MRDVMRAVFEAISIPFLVGLCVCHWIMYDRPAAVDTWRLNR